MGMIKKALLEYEKLIGTEISLSLNNGDMIHFVFKPAAFPHLVGLQHLVDIPDLFEYKEGRLPAFDDENLIFSINTGKSLKNLTFLNSDKRGCYSYPIHIKSNDKVLQSIVPIETLLG